jgi:hypothetical protein
MNGQNLIAGTISVSQDGMTATFTPSVPSAASTVITVQATTGILDLEAQEITLFQSSFTTASQ